MEPTANPYGLPRRAHVSYFEGCPLGCTWSSMAKLTSSPTGLPMWGLYWPPISGRTCGAQTKPKGLIRRLPIWGEHGARGQMDIEPIWAAHVGPILETHNGLPKRDPH